MRLSSEAIHLKTACDAAYAVAPKDNSADGRGRGSCRMGVFRNVGRLGAPTDRCRRHGTGHRTGQPAWPCLSHIRQGTSSVARDTTGRIQGLMLGFAVGDALGAPVAGLPSVCDGHRLPSITGFTTNPDHPYFGRLGRGCYTENTCLLLEAARDYSDRACFDRELRTRTLVHWARRMHSDPESARWPGETTLEGARQLALGTPARAVSRDSVGAVYRCLPIAVIVADGAARDSMVAAEVGLTHSHPDCVTGAALVVDIARQILLGQPPLRALQSGLDRRLDVEGSTPLLDRCQAAIDGDPGDTDFRSRWGTGARCRETIPLSLAILAHFAASPSDALLYAANCGKPDYSGTWDKDTAQRNGGNSDGIAALVGALVGALFGGETLLAAWPDVENARLILEHAARLAECFRG
jgi:ADP-ribosylglycohydrolase